MIQNMSLHCLEFPGLCHYRVEQFKQETPSLHRSSNLFTYQWSLNQLILNPFVLQRRCTGFLCFSKISCLLKSKNVIHKWTTLCKWKIRQDPAFCLSQMTSLLQLFFFLSNNSFTGKTKSKCPIFSWSYGLLHSIIGWEEERDGLVSALPALSSFQWAMTGQKCIN